VSSTGLDCVVLGGLFTTEELRGAFDSSALVQAWLDVEAALARAEAEVGVIPAEAAAEISAKADVAAFDLQQIGAEVHESQHPLVPLVRMLAARCGGEAGAYVHWGATTQDVVDTGLVLQMRAALRPISRDLRRAIEAAAALARNHRDLPMAGRTHGQHAVPITFGLKAATWTDELARAEQRLDAATAGAAILQFGGAAGTLASLGNDASAVRGALARDLRLAETDVPWHATRDRLRDLAHALAEVGATAERIAAEIIRLQETETAEVAEPSTAASVGSSTMPQKRNPMTCEYVVASARLLRSTVQAVLDSPAHAGERDMGLWAAEWVALPNALMLSGGIVAKLAPVLEGLVVDGERMRANLELTRGTILAEAAMMELARTIGHEPAHVLVTAISSRVASDERTTLTDALEADAEAARHLSAEALERLRRPDGYLGLAGVAADAVQRSAR
jgi:adenylosuccinate lyase/3-carboxy-cis,cis-muconate cycloisomerase